MPQRFPFGSIHLDTIWPIVGLMAFTIGPTADINVTAGLALATSHAYFYAGFQTRSFGYLERLGPTGIRASAGRFVFIFAIRVPETELHAPTADINVTAGLALATSHAYFYAGFQTRSFGYVAYLLPINLLEDFSKPLSLSFRVAGVRVGSFVFISARIWAGALLPIDFSLAGDFRVGLEHGRFMLHQSEGQQLGVSSEVMLAAREVIRLQSTATKLLSKLLAIPTEWSAMDYEQYCSTSQALITGFFSVSGTRGGGDVLGSARSAHFLPCWPGPLAIVGFVGMVHFFGAFFRRHSRGRLRGPFRRRPAKYRDA